MRMVGTCPMCESASGEVFSLDHFVIAECPECQHRFADGPVGRDHVTTVYGDDYFFGGKDGYDDYLADGDLLRDAGRRYGAILARHGEPARLLDVGAAAGFLQAGYADKGWTTTGLEPNAAMSAHARERLGLESIVGDLETARGLPEFDTVCLIQVIGHFHDLPRALDRVRDLTRPGGLVLVEYWRRESRIARLLGKRWHEYSPPSVLHYFSRQSLDSMMASRGLGCVASGVPKKYISGHHAQSLLSYKLQSFGLGWLPRLIPANLRIRYPAFDLEWRLYRRDSKTEEGQA